jgi:DinB superfamily
MSIAVADKSSNVPNVTSARANVLAERLEQGARALAALAETITDVEWESRVADGRKIGVVVHHVASMYPIEIQLAGLLAAGQPIEGVTPAVVADINAKHAVQYDGVTKAEALALLRANSEAAATGVRALTDEQLNRAATVSYNSDAPLTCQFWVEDHPVRHSYHHLARIRAALKR